MSTDKIIDYHSCRFRELRMREWEELNLVKCQIIYNQTKYWWKYGLRKCKEYNLFLLQEKFLF